MYLDFAGPHKSTREKVTSKLSGSTLLQLAKCHQETVSSNNRQVIRSKIKEVPVAWGKAKKTNRHKT